MAIRPGFDLKQVLRSFALAAAATIILVCSAFSQVVEFAKGENVKSISSSASGTYIVNLPVRPGVGELWKVDALEPHGDVDSKSRFISSSGGLGGIALQQITIKLKAKFKGKIGFRLELPVRAASEEIRTLNIE